MLLFPSLSQFAGARSAAPDGPRNNRASHGDAPSNTLLVKKSSMQENRPDATPPRFPLHHLRMIKAEDIFQGDREVLIDYRGAVYKLRITKQGKLILNKP